MLKPALGWWFGRTVGTATGRPRSCAGTRQEEEEEEGPEISAGRKAAHSH